MASPRPSQQNNKSATNSKANKSTQTRPVRITELSPSDQDIPQSVEETRQEDDDRGFEKSMEESGEGQKAPSQLVIPKPKKQKKL